MTREEAIHFAECLKHNWTINFNDMEDFCDMAIEALSQPNYETDTEVRLAVTNRKKEKVILWDAYGEVEYYPIKALSAEQKEEELAKDIARDMATIIENEQDMRVILKNASTELLDDGTLKVNVQNGTEVNRVLVWGDDGCGGLYYADDRPNIAYFCDGAGCDGECNECHHTTDIKHAKNFNIIGGKQNIKYIETDYRPSGEWVIVNKGLDIYICDQCGEVEQIQRIPIWGYCPNCGAKMGSDTR